MNFGLNRLAALFAAVLTCASCSLAMAQEEQGGIDERLKQLMQKNNCTACHYVDKRKYGPMLLEVGSRYRGTDAATRQRLLDKMQRGGSGVWGEDPMPPQPQLTDEDARQLLALILSLPPRAP